MCIYNKISEKRGHEYEREQKGYMGGFWGRRGKGKLCNSSVLSKDKISKWLLISTYLWGSFLQISLCYWFQILFHCASRWHLFVTSEFLYLVFWPKIWLVLEKCSIYAMKCACLVGWITLNNSLTCSWLIVCSSLLLSFNRCRGFICRWRQGLKVISACCWTASICESTSVCLCVRGPVVGRTHAYSGDMSQVNSSTIMQCLPLSLSNFLSFISCHCCSTKASLASHTHWISSPLSHVSQTCMWLCIWLYSWSHVGYICGSFFTSSAPLFSCGKNNLYIISLVLIPLSCIACVSFLLSLSSLLPQFGFYV